MPAITAEVRHIGEQTKTIRILQPEDWADFYSSSSYATELYKGPSFDFLTGITEDGREFFAVHSCIETIVYINPKNPDLRYHSLDRRPETPSLLS